MVPAHTVSVGTGSPENKGQNAKQVRLQWCQRVVVNGIKSGNKPRKSRNTFVRNGTWVDPQNEPKLRGYNLISLMQTQEWKDVRYSTPKTANRLVQPQTREKMVLV